MRTEELVELRSFFMREFFTMSANQFAANPTRQILLF